MPPSSIPHTSIPGPASHPARRPARGRTTMKTYVRGVSLLAALLLTLTACGGRANAQSAAAPPPAGAPGVGPPGPGDKTGVTQGDILSGTPMPLSGPVGVLVGNGWKGTDAYFKATNDAGGVNGRKLKLVVDDDKYSAQGAASAIRDLVDSKKVFSVACPVGVDQCSVAVDYANRKRVPYLSRGFREQYLQDKPWAFPATASYPYGGNRLLDYMVQKRGYPAKRKIR